MKYLKTFEKKFNYFIELTYSIYDEEVMVDIQNENVIDIYASYDNNLDFIDWKKGQNSLFVHCDPDDYHIILDELLNNEDSYLFKDEEEDEEFYEYIEENLRKKLDFLKITRKYNL